MTDAEIDRYVMDLRGNPKVGGSTPSRPTIRV